MKLLRLLLFPAPRRSIALGHGGFIYFDVLWMPPVGHIITLAGEDVEVLQDKCITAIIPAITTINTQAATPAAIHVAPHLICQNQIKTTLDSLCIGMAFKVLQSLSRIAPVINFPGIVNITNLPAAIGTICRVDLFQFITRLCFEPQFFCIFNIKKICRSYLTCVSCTTPHHQKETCHAQ